MPTIPFCLPSPGRRALLAAVVALAGVLAAACGGGGDDEVDGGGAPQTIQELMEARQNVIAERNLDLQAAIQACMQAEGFEYTPVDDTAQTGGFGAFNSDDFREEYGYGVSTLFGGALPFAIRDAADDPNQTYLQSLSEADRTAYYTALYGAPVEIDGPGGGAVVQARPVGVGGAFGGTGADAGCYGAANVEVFGKEFANFSFTDIAEQMEAATQRLESDPRMVEAWEAWAGCMADAGYPYTDEDEVIEDLQARMTSIVGESAGFGGAGGRRVFVTAPAGSTQEGPAPVEYDEAALAALQAEERAIAGAGQSCREDHVDEVEAAVREEIESELLADNPELLSGLSGDAR